MNTVRKLEKQLREEEVINHHHHRFIVSKNVENGILE